MGLSIADRVEIVSCKGVFTADELAQIFEVNRGQVTRVWYNEANGIVVKPKIGLDAPASKPHGLKWGDWSSQIVDAIEVPPDQIVATGKTLETLEPQDCRWIIGKDDEGDWRYCGCQRAKNVHRQIIMYCSAHGVAALEQPDHAAHPVEIVERIAHEAKPDGPNPTEFIYLHSDLVSDIARNRSNFENAHYYNMGRKAS